ncbi:MAG: hypothetical protein P8H96_12145, partial [Akkermansiaceae bacterium]|nr:hypothetical protein [Akkermansiaceae bacterium]
AGGMENFGQSMENERIHEQILSLSHEISNTSPWIEVVRGFRSLCIKSGVHRLEEPFGRSDRGVLPSRAIIEGLAGIAVSQATIKFPGDISGVGAGIAEKAGV